MCSTNLPNLYTHREVNFRIFVSPPESDCVCYSLIDFETNRIPYNSDHRRIFSLGFQKFSLEIQFMNFEIIYSYIINPTQKNNIFLKIEKNEFHHVLDTYILPFENGCKSRMSYISQ